MSRTGASKGFGLLGMLGPVALVATVVTVFALGAPKALEKPVGKRTPITVEAHALPLDYRDPERTSVGLLRYRGGVELTSDHVQFGGFSALKLDSACRDLLTVSDHGEWLHGRLVYDSEGTLTGLTDTELAPMLGANGLPLARKWYRDAESLAPGQGDTIVVSMEQHHRILVYPDIDSAPTAMPHPAGIKKAHGNGGMETLTRLADGRYLTIAEKLAVEGGRRGWIGGNGRDWAPLTYTTDAGFEPTGATTLPNGDVLFVERRVLPPAARIRRVRREQLQPDAVLTPTVVATLSGSLVFDNMEGIDTCSIEPGVTRVYLISDDNFNALQRTLLLAFDLIEK